MIASGCGPHSECQKYHSGLHYGSPGIIIIGLSWHLPCVMEEECNSTNRSLRVALREMRQAKEEMRQAKEESDKAKEKSDRMNKKLLDALMKAGIGKFKAGR